MCRQLSGNLPVAELSKIMSKDSLKGTTQEPASAEKVLVCDWDLNELMERLGGHQEFLRDLLVIFQQEAPANLGKSRNALAAGDFPGLIHAAHTLKGMLKNLAMGTAGQTAAALETAARKESLEESKRRLEQLAGELGSLFPEVEARMAEVKS
jgi:HPt (histidine-containing phosphotransfer) domain-containing protein